MPIRRLYILCEGLTEEAFVNRVLRPHFLASSETLVIPILASNRRGSNSRRHKGGWTSYVKAREALHRLMKQNHGEDTWFTSLLDLYAIPDDFPGLRSNAAMAARQRVVALETAFSDDVASKHFWRFTPHLQLHEYEALLLVDVGAIARALPNAKASAATALIADIGGVEPEDVDGGRETAPSKRIIRHFATYEGRKATAGPLIAAEIGLPRLRAACPHFDGWLTALEARCRE